MARDSRTVLSSDDMKQRKLLESIPPVCGEDNLTNCILGRDQGNIRCELRFLSIPTYYININLQSVCNACGNVIQILQDTPIIFPFTPFAFLICRLEKIESSSEELNSLMQSAWNYLEKMAIKINEEILQTNGNETFSVVQLRENDDMDLSDNSRGHVP